MCYIRQHTTSNFHQCFFFWQRSHVFLGFYHILLYGTSAFSGVTLEVVNVTVASLTLGVPATNLTGRSREEMFFKLSVPSGSFVQLLAIHAFGGSGNVDLFMRNLYLPTTSSYGLSSRREDNNEEISFPVPHHSKFSLSFQLCCVNVQFTSLIKW